MARQQIIVASEEGLNKRGYFSDCDILSGKRSIKAIGGGMINASNNPSLAEFERY